MASGSRLERIRSALEKLRGGDPDREVFGSESHEHRLGPTLDEASIARIEKQLSIALPAAYRTFLIELGNGGAGPGYGLQRLAVGAPARGKRSGWESHGWTMAQRLADEPTAPSAAFPRQTPFLPDDVPDDDRARWRDGSLYLADYGCAIEARLVLNGPLRGHVWMIDGSNGAFVPFGMMAGIHSSGSRGDEQSTEPFDFLAWYEHWLDLTLDELGTDD